MLGTHDCVGGVEVKHGHHNRHRGDEGGHPGRELVLDALFLLDHFLGPLQRLGADFGRGLVQQRGVFAHCLPKMKSPASTLDGARVPAGLT